MDLTGIGVVGCGRMGLPMLKALRASGFDAYGHDIRYAESYGEDAHLIMDDIVAFAKHTRILLSVVRDIDDTEDALFNGQGFAVNAPWIETIVICSTLSPRYVRDLRKRIPDDMKLVDAPMSGAAIGAEERRLSFMLGGDVAELDRLQPLFDAMGTNFHRMGKFGSGMQAKVLNNLLAASSTAMTRLVLDWAAQSGLEERALLDVIETSSGQNWLASGMDTIEFARDGYSDDNTIGILVKDVESALDAAPENADADLPRTVQQFIRKLRPLE
jgi:3-hydroxyisobutyrate dehydrogenase-like beta-hydroxyacid dehydrogenase